MRAFLIAFFIVVPFIAAQSEPPPGTDPNSSESQWYRTLSQPKTGYLCCSVSDCRNVEYRSKDNHFEVFIKKSVFPNGDDNWHDVPPENIITNQNNPTGEAVACWYAHEVRCFVLPTMG